MSHVNRELEQKPAAVKEQKMKNDNERRYRVMVHFATGYSPECVGTTDLLELAENTARKYLGADAKGVWINDTIKRTSTRMEA